jgi:integrase
MQNKNKSNETIKTYTKIYNRYKSSGQDKFIFANNLKNKNLISQFKNSLKLFENLSKSDEKEINKIYDKKPKRKAIPKEQFKVLSFWNSINNCRNIKEKLPFRLNILIGARIDELANIQKQDITFLEDGRIKVFLRKCKGGKERTIVSIMKDKYVYNKLLELLDTKKDTDRVFYSKNYLYKIAKRHNFINHDLRKTCIQTIYYKCDMDKETTLDIVRAYAGHEKGNTYKYYLSRDINAYNTKFDI